MKDKKGFQPVIVSGETIVGEMRGSSYKRTARVKNSWETTDRRNRSLKAVQLKSADRDISGVTTLVSNVIDIDAIPRRLVTRRRAKSIKIMDSNQKNRVSAVRES